ncbi:MAG TPA: diol dehydratase small subunit [Roseiflexaceae bacterium]|nr:diol dehydratase small subunit [Roseiflexaceae bacterium]HMP40662.1 diol dehydratase small subunit [Roseiflexaceae bacterium]
MHRTRPQYPLIDDASLQAANGRPLSEITPEAAAGGVLGLPDLQISATTLQAQAQIAREAGFRQLGENLERAAELTRVPNAEVLRMYELLRPGRSSFDELAALAQLLEEQYDAPICAALVREAAHVYRARGLFDET